MVEKISNYIVDNYFYKKEKPKSEDEREILLFGTKRIVEDIPKAIIIIAIMYFTNNLYELGIVFLITLLYKAFIGGAHARTNFGCLIGTLIIFSIPIIISKFDIDSYIINSVLILNYIYSLYVIYVIAPSDTEEVPIINKKLRRKLKILGFISLNLIYGYMMFNLVEKDLIEIIVFTLLTINLWTSNLMYKILRCTRGKYSIEYRDLYN